MSAFSLPQVSTGLESDDSLDELRSRLVGLIQAPATKLARLLIEHGADVNTIEQWKGQTALMWASAQNQPEMVELLIEHGADQEEAVAALLKAHGWANIRCYKDYSGLPRVTSANYSETP